MKVEMLIRLTWQNKSYEPRMGVIDLPDNVALDWANRAICKIVKTIEPKIVPKPVQEIKPPVAVNVVNKVEVTQPTAKFDPHVGIHEPSVKKVIK